MSSLAKSSGYGPSSAADPNEGRRYGGAFWVSAGLHGAAVVLLVVLTLAVKDEIDREPNVFQVVAGPGDNYMATEAPAGNEAGRGETGELTMPTLQPTPTWTPPAEPVPVEPVSTPPSAVESTPPVVETPPVPVPNFASNIKATIRQEKRKVEREIKKQRAADAAAEKAAAEATKRQATSYEQFQKQNAGKTAAKTATKPASSSGASPNPGQRLDPNNIKRGVTGGTGAGSTGAGGTALTAAQGAAMDRYDAMLRAKLREKHELPPGVSDLLSAEVVFNISANGTISGVRIVRSSGSPEFDESVIAAFTRVFLPPRPDGRSDSQRLTFRIREI